MSDYRGPSIKDVRNIWPPAPLSAGVRLETTPLPLDLWNWYSSITVYIIILSGVIILTVVEQLNTYLNFEPNVDVHFWLTAPPPTSACVRFCLTPSPPQLRTSFMDDPLNENMAKYALFDSMLVMFWLATVA